MYLLLKILLLIFCLLAVAFYTLFERKILSLSQIRVGPNKLIFFGVLQPVLDGLKLMLKEAIKVMFSSFFIFFIPSFFLFGTMLQFWFLVPSVYSLETHKLQALFVMAILGFMVYSAILIGLVSSSKFGFLGAMRNACQSVSYEISMNFQILCLLMVLVSLSLKSFLFFWTNFSFFLCLIWWISCVCECNRAPFDFAEGESELISGFNVEYSSIGFIFIFLGEYGMMLSLSLLSSFFFFSGSLLIFIFLFFSLIVFRTSYPRFRFDLLMKFCWIFLLPLVICLFFFYSIF